MPAAAPGPLLPAAAPGPLLPAPAAGAAPALVAAALGAPAVRAFLPPLRSCFAAASCLLRSLISALTSVPPFLCVAPLCGALLPVSLPTSAVMMLRRRLRGARHSLYN